MPGNVIVDDADPLLRLAVMALDSRNLLRAPGLWIVLGDSGRASLHFLVPVLDLAGNGAPLGLQEHARAVWERLLPILDFAIVVWALKNESLAFDLFCYE